MKKSNDPQSLDTANRIKQAAREVFLSQGPHNARTWEIANAAGLNPALINYYFRNKDKLYQIVMLEELGRFLQTIVPIVSDRTTLLERKIELLVERYFAMADQGPHLPMFILNEMFKGHSGLKNQIKKQRNMLHRSEMADQLHKAIKAGKYRNVSFSEVIINVIGLNIFPIIAAPAMQIMGGLTDEEYTRMLQVRRQKVYEWVLYMLK
jgi:AcrR family transcriptional regulator